MPTGTMHDFFAFLTDLMTQHAAMFESMGVNMFRGFAVILIVWFGAKTALSAAGGGQSSGFHFDHFASLLMTIAFGFGMMNFYSRPIPGFGVSFYHLITDQGLNLSNQMDHAMLSEVWDRLGNLYWGMETPALTSVFNIVEIVRY